MPRSLILEPTRELAAQVAENFEKYGKGHKLSMALLIGGVQMGDQVAALERGVDVLIATPGRLMDLFGRGKILLTGCSMLVIDEADRMLDMGFIPDIEEICTKLPKQRQTLLFSATMPAPIKKLADKFLDNPKMIEVSRPASSNLNITQYLVPVDGQRSKQARLRALLAQPEVESAIIFCNRKTTVRELNKALRQNGYRSGEIHGDMEQSERIAELDRFKAGEVNILVASDVAARGLDIKGVSHVFNYDAPWHPDDYVHRIGRTGRAGATGVAYTLIAPDDAENIANIEKLTGQVIQRLGAVAQAEPVAEETPAERPRGGRGRASDEARPAREPRARTARVPEERQREERRDEQPIAPAPGREEVAPRRDDRRPPRADLPVRAERDTRPSRAERDDRYRRDARESRDDGPDDGWNGPVPDFLSASIA